MLNVQKSSWYSLILWSRRSMKSIWNINKMLQACSLSNYSFKCVISPLIIVLQHNFCKLNSALKHQWSKCYTYCCFRILTGLNFVTVSKWYIRLNVVATEFSSSQYGTILDVKYVACYVINCSYGSLKTFTIEYINSWTTWNIIANIIELNIWT